MKAAVVGSGAWGTALAVRLCKNGHDVTMWTYEKDKIPEMLETHHNPRLPAAVLPETLKISGDYDCVRGCKLVVMATPSFPLRAVSRGVAPYIDEDAVVVSVTKGLEQGTHLRMSQVVAQETGKNVVALTGPSHAEEVCINLPTGLLAASTDQALAEFVQDAFMADTLRVYTSPDVVDLYSRYNVLSRQELKARQEIYIEQYCKTIRAEANLVIRMGRTIIYPAGLRFQQELLRACLDMRALNREPDTVLLDDIDDTLRKLREGLEHLENNVDMKIEDPVQEAHHKCTVVIPAMNAIRTLADHLETIVPEDLWPLPSYQEMLFVK